MSTSAERRSFSRRMAWGYVGMFAPFAVLLAFVPLWFEAVGLDDGEIGVLISITLLVRTITTPPLTALADRFRDRSVVYVVAAAGAAVASLGYVLPPSLPLLTIVATLVAVGMAPAIPVGDAIGLTGVRRYGADYGSIRLWGSVAFMVVTIAAGELVRVHGVQLVPPLFTALLVVTLLTGLRLPRLTMPGKVRRHSVRSVATRPMMVVLAASALAIGSHATFYGFSSIHWARLGFSETFIGLLWAVGVFAEIVLFAIARRAALDAAPLTLMIVGAALGAARWAMFTVEGGMAWYTVNSLLHAASFAAVHLALQSYIAEHVDDERQASAQALSQGFAGPVMAAATFASGWLYGALAADAFWLPAVMCAAATVMLAPLLNPRGRGRAARR